MSDLNPATTLPLGAPMPAGLLRRQVMLGLMGACAASVRAAPVTAALDRPALIARNPSHAVLLGAAHAGSRVVAVGERGLVLLSDDQGRSWRQARVPVSVSLTAVGFADAEHGYATGHGGTVLRTKDGGLSWHRALDGRALATLMNQEAAAKGDEAARRAAARLVADGPDKPLLDLLVTDRDHVLALGAYGLAVATRDGGESWAPVNSRFDNRKGLHLYALRKRDQVVAVAGEQGLLLRSDDAGATFRRIAVPYEGSFFTVELPSQREMILGGLRGNLWRTVDSGNSWIRLATPSPATVTGSALRDDGSLILVNQAGLVLGGRAEALVPWEAPQLPPLTGVLPMRNGSLLALSVQGAHVLRAPSIPRSTN